MIDPCFDLYKKARNQLRKYQTASMVSEILNVLHESHVEGIETWNRYPPWNLLLVLKWTYQESDAVSHRRPLANRNVLHHILNTIFEIDNLRASPDKYDHINLLMRQIAFQQFIFQKAPDTNSLARQWILFGELETNHRFCKKIKILTGLEIKEFIQVSFALLAIVIQKPCPKKISIADFQLLKSNLSENALDKFFRFLSKNINGLKNFLSQPNFKKQLITDQLMILSPLINFPLLEHKKYYWIYFPPLVLRSIETAVYRALRNENPSEFGNKFGVLFEKYVDRCLKSANLKYINEEQIKKNCGDGKCVDFLIQENNCNVFIDSKAVEMSIRGRVSTRSDAVAETIKETVFKAIDQAFETYNRLNNLGNDFFKRRAESFLVIVTFDDLYLGSSIDLETIFNETIFSKYKNKYGNIFPIPSENIFIISIQELENLLWRICLGKTSFYDVFQYAKNQDKNPKTKKFCFQQHLETLCPITGHLPIIKDAFNDLSNKTIQLALH